MWSLIWIKVKHLIYIPGAWGLSIRMVKFVSHFTLSQKNKGHQVSFPLRNSHDGAIYNLCGLFGSEITYLKYQLCEDFLRCICDNRSENFRNVLIERPPCLHSSLSHCKRIILLMFRNNTIMTKKLMLLLLQFTCGSSLRPSHSQTYWTLSHLWEDLYYYFFDVANKNGT